ncbi:MAG: DUF262 domain-containing protein [Variovorax sp.]|nr:MAG: DUF262 domain-containing protein [Variovorax sp.]
MGKRSTTTKDVALLRQLLQDGQVKLAPEFQRNAVWPPAAKAYLIDTILSDRPMPLFFFQRGRSAQTGKPIYSVVDGQQRLRSIFEFIDDRFSLSQSKEPVFKGKKFSQLSVDLQDKVLNYDLNIEELSGYNEDEIRDIFVRMNKYVVKLSPQELRHAREQGKFYDFIEELAKLPFWRDEGVFSKTQFNRMRAAEFAAELAVLLIEGPQDKKGSLDLYYGEYQKRFPQSQEVKSRLIRYLEWTKAAIPELAQSRFRRPVDLYSLIAALESITRSGTRLAAFAPARAQRALADFEHDLSSKRPSRLASQYLAAARQQTDNIGPRTVRLEALSTVLGG